MGWAERDRELIFLKIVICIIFIERLCELVHK
jgi:hypothetical protein